MRKLIVETIEEETPPEEITPPVMEKPVSEPALPDFFSEPKQKVNKEDDVVDLKVVGKSLSSLSQVQSISMSVPAFLVIIAILGGIAFVGGKLASSKSTEKPVDTAQPVILGSATQSTSPVAGTPEDIISDARSQFAKAIENSKKPNQSDSDKEAISRSILSILDELGKGIAAYPNNGSLYFERAQVEKMVMQSAPKLINQAEDDYSKAVSLSPLSGDFYIGFADYFDVLGDKQKAIENYQKASQLDPKSIDALYPLAKLYVGQSRVSEALSIYTKIMALLSPSSPQYTQIQQEMMDLQNQVQPSPSPAAQTASPSASQTASPSAGTL